MSRDAADFPLDASNFESIIELVEQESDVLQTISSAEVEAFVGEDPGAAFEPQALELLARLDAEDKPEYERVRKTIGKVSRLGEVDKAVRKFRGESEVEDGEAVHETLLRLAKDNAEFFRSSEGATYGLLKNSDVPEIWPLNSGVFRKWLGHLYYKETDGAPSKEVFSAVLNVLEAIALYEGPEHSVHLRTASEQSSIYVDMVNKDWSVIEVTSQSWSVTKESEVRFRRSPGMLSLPEPAAKENGIDDLRPLVNLPDENSFRLLIFWMLTALRGKGPYPILVLNGEQGSSKSTFSKIVRGLIDPNSADLRTLPREEREFFISASNSHLLAFDNISRITDQMSDTICRIATGAGASFRQLYTDQDEIIFQVSKPIILNGIGSIVERADLADRCIFINLKPIPVESRKSQSELMEQFEAARPGILAALLDGLSCGLRNIDLLVPADLPRMADFAIWSMACETAYGVKGTFNAAYNQNLNDSVEVLLEDDPLFLALKKATSDKEKLKGTSTELLMLLNGLAQSEEKKSKAWPGNASQLGNRLKRMAPNLRKMGWTIDQIRAGGNGDRVWIVEGLIPEVSEVSEVTDLERVTNWTDTSDSKCRDS